MVSLLGFFRIDPEQPKGTVNVLTAAHPGSQGRLIDEYFNPFYEMAQQYHQMPARVNFTLPASSPSSLIEAD